ncbi:MAG: hypothetical protein RRB13_04055 [bacterium]|nr:hypothetical protein [bacterium]
MSWEQAYLEQRLKNQLSIHDNASVKPDQFVAGLGEIYDTLLVAAKQDQPGAKVKLADFAVEYLNIGRSVFQGGAAYHDIKTKVLADLGALKPAV